MFFDQVLAFDHVKKEIHLIVTADLTRRRASHPSSAWVGEESPNPGAPSKLRLGGSEVNEAGAPSKLRLGGREVSEAYARALKRLKRLEKRLARALPKPAKKHARTPAQAKLQLTSRTAKPAFLKSVRRAKQYIASGDVFQCVLSQRFDCVPGVDAFDVYRALRIVNPSPYMYFLRFGLDAQPPTPEAVILSEGRSPKSKDLRLDEPSASTTVPSTLPMKSAKKPKKLKGKHAKRSALREVAVHHIVGSSPELLVRVHGRDIEYRPIAGTRPRSADEVEDRRLEADLRADEKEVAEHIMLVDLGRNDVGRVSEYGSVKVKDLMFVERYSHVMHLVSTLEGRLRPELAAIDAFRACFPAGTLSGAPKIRAMEIIEELEPARRGVYGGSIFYADFSGNLDSCIAIRTLYMDGEQGHIQAGAGIVADSIPENEYVECANKARAVVRAIERARGK